jgi:hypothetical protein
MAIRPLIITTSLLFASVRATAGEFPRFEEVTIDPHCGEVCYAVTLADVDGDGRQDIVAVTENRVLWYQAPDWKRRVILEDQTERDNVCVAPHDIDGDGQIDFALGAGWLGQHKGTIQWLSRGQSLDEPWNVHMIGSEPWTHRMRWADVLGTGKPQLTVSPLNKTQGDGVRLLAFEIPDDPKTDRWPSTVLDDSLNRMHNHWHAERPGQSTGPALTLTASQEGVHVVLKSRDGDWRKFQINEGAPGKQPAERGAGEIKSGRLSDEVRLITTIEPMHGTSVVVYTRPEERGEPWNRHVLDDTLRRGHALWTADIDGDGADELIVGHSDAGTGEIKGPGVYIYDCQNDQGTKWTKHVVDNGGMATEDLICADLTGDGRIDIVAGGRQTHNVKLYVNLGGQNEQRGGTPH